MAHFSPIGTNEQRITYNACKTPTAHEHAVY